MEEIVTKLIVIGGGPGGYVTAIRASQLGVPTILVEETQPGGTCLNIGCIPSKALIHVAEAYHQARSREAQSPFGLSVSGAQLDFGKSIAWKDGIVARLTSGVTGLLKKYKAALLIGRAELIDGKTVVVQSATGAKRIRAEHVVIATGSRPAALPNLPFGDKVISSTEALSLNGVPASLAIVGAGYIGLELGTALAKLGASVTVVEATDKILPTWDAELTRPVAARLEALGIRVLTGARALGLSTKDGSLEVLENGAVHATALSVDRILVAVGRRPRTEGFGLDRLDLDMDGSFIRVDDRCMTSMRDVWAIGDVTGEPMLAHRAMAQGEMVAELIAGRRRRFDPAAIPAVCFTDPEIVSAGLSPADAKAAGHEVVVATFPFVANGRAMTQDDDAGFVRVVANALDERVLGIQAVGREVSELSATFGLALEMGARLQDIAATIHTHPTRGEALQEAALRALGHALHL
ncbi:dihydrolipoyl dehydrogenase [Mesorhizobium sp. ANAO-SY3R2]|uniref:dihydrolipoyl dehydrogenase n=1 Tax=Mesorhizobium sp. ANAO-SY3R2 TaxID=3166644 RepID=UPI00366CBB2B